MFSIKQSFADCSSCDLLRSPSCILETNCEDDLTKVEIIFVAENPGKQEVEKELPLVGRAGKMFRKYFKKFNIDKQKYLLTNCVLCQTLNPDGRSCNRVVVVINKC
jgi:uracil-DNA glycosylase family 4